MPTTLSVNVNKIATLRNSRGGNNPDLIQWIRNIESYGADGITVHPRPDERHIRYQDVRDMKSIINTELNIEGNPKEEKFIDLVLATRPAQVTLVPDDPYQLTSNHGWNIKKDGDYLGSIIPTFKAAGIRVSIFMDPNMEGIKAAADTGTDRVELYTEDYARQYHSDKDIAVAPYILAAIAAHEAGLGINAGHDLDLHNLKYFAEHVPHLLEVSIGHALISDALKYGMQNTVQMYKRCLNAYYL